MQAIHNLFLNYFMQFVNMCIFLLFRSMKAEAKDKAHLIHTLRSVREKRGLNQTQVADIMGVRQDTVSRLEAGRFHPNWDTLKRYCDAVGAKIFLHWS